MELKLQIEAVTGIELGVLEGITCVKDVDITSRVKWIRGRETTKPQDLAYCLLQILDVKMEVDYEKTVEDTFVELQQKLVDAHSELSPSSHLELTWGFFAAGHPVPPISWLPHEFKVRDTC
ncbi:hypothetical protein VKT23_008989 [Stygiomarasmius scandens]|uniref:Uncharacterized protein n=1 Tax=Marasmiellus scandens TaxID=2682957 RepID=A0ABR1JH83_9AGAR